MKKTLLLCITIFILTGCTQQSEQEQEQDPAEAIFALELKALTRWTQGDTYGFIDIAAPKISYFAEGIDTLIVGIEAFKAVNAPLDGTFRIPKIKIKNPTTNIYGDMGIITYTLLNLDENDTETSRWKSTEVYQKQEEGWKLLHSHWTIVK